MRQRRLVVCVVAVLAAVVGTAACGVGLAEQATGDFTVSLSTDPPVRAGEEPITVQIVPTGPEPAGDVEVLFHYYPFVHRVKDSLASPDEVVRVVPATPSSEGYRATLELDRPGPWKVAVRIIQAAKPDTIVYFTLHAEESPGAGDD